MNETKTLPTLFYAHDPMCSWCWGFAPTWQTLRNELAANYKDRLAVEMLLGGLAPDSDEPMPQQMQSHLRQTWESIAERIPGTRFNFDFWEHAKPRRSTWPACRAVIAARNQGPQYTELMSHGIQHAYYLEARNPSDLSTLVDIAASLELDTDRFAADVESAETRARHQQEMGLVQQLGVQGFPSLALVLNNQAYGIRVDYTDADQVLGQIDQVLEQVGNAA